jgi:glycosyltransferase involved in cell wall biosynthesis
MVQAEALACGTPVLAMNRGSVPEVLRHGVTALIGNSVDELVALAPELGKLNRYACRREAEQRFSSRALALGYEQVYRMVIAERKHEELAIALGAPPESVRISA